MTDEGPTATTGPSLLLGLEPGDLGSCVLLPGDPDRIATLAALWEDVREFGFVRGFRAAAGTYRGERVAALSTGIGGPSTEIALVQAALLGVETFVRVGTTGSLWAEIPCGDLIINDAAVRLDGTSHLYVRGEFPAVASYEVTLALVEACERLGVRYHVGTGATAGSFYTGQGRPSFGGYLPPEAADLVEAMRRINVLNLEMEAATIFTLARLWGLRAGAVCAVVANRITGEWDERGVESACRVATEASAILSEWDRKKTAAGRQRLSPAVMS